MPDGVPRVQLVLPAKPWWRSRVLWLNALALALAGAESQLHVLQPLLPVNVYLVLAFALPVANALLRAITTQPLGIVASVPVSLPAGVAAQAQHLRVVAHDPAPANAPPAGPAA